MSDLFEFENMTCSKVKRDGIWQCSMNFSLVFSFTVSDTGVGSTFEEFLGLKFANDPIVADKWGK